MKTIPERVLERTKERLLAQIEIDENGCWLWTGRQTVHGYGKLTVAQHDVTTHRLAWMALNGPIPDLHPGTAHGTCVCHTCDVRTCINPAHLWLGSIGDNLRDCAEKGRNAIRETAKKAALMRATKLACINGHPYLPDNLYICTRGKRQCRICRQLADQRRWAKRKLTPVGSLAS